MGGGDHSKHGLGNIEGMSPIVVSDIAIILLDGADPTTKDAIINVETMNEVQIDEHPKSGLGNTKGLSLFKTFM